MAVDTISASEPASANASDKPATHRQPPPAAAASAGGSSAPPSHQGSSEGRASVVTEPEASHKGAVESVGSKESGSGRPRNGSLRTRENDRSSTSTPRRAQRQRPAHSTTLDAFAPQKDRKTNNFKVGNVGLGGRIYLRPVTRPVPPQSSTMPQSPSRSKPPGAPFAAQSHSDQPNVRLQRPASSSIEEEPADFANNLAGASSNAVKGTRTDFTGRESVWTKLSTHDLRGAPSDIFKHQASQSRPRRSMSESTAEHSPQGRPAALAQTKAFKVVIDRPDSDLSFQRTKSRNATSALDIPIPHYRMGSPRFTATGTPFLHSSVYTQSQSNLAPNSSGVSIAERSPNASSSTIQQQRSTYIPTTSPSLPNRRHSHAAPFPRPASIASHDSAMNSPSDPPAWRQPSINDGESISPRIYDSLAAAPNDPSVIKYSASGEVIAATPARLIVQITAETFLDYELLSDFFLTVRCYLSTHTLLALLLARFEWAVNRYDDNGRIIRVRSFAAIRHWILNYFAYDFAPDRKLRVTFCRKLNAIFKVVQTRTEMGASDTKLIADLKKCWNGRCVMYWDRQVDNALEADILPGGSSPDGKTGSEELDEYGLGSVTAASTDMYSVPASPSADYDLGEEDSHASGSRRHTRTTSGTTSLSAPLSPTSDVSAPVMSCSIPAMMAKKVIQSSRQLVGPVPVYQRPHTGGNRQSNGSSDAVREAQSLERQNAGLYSLHTPVYRSVLRGHLLPPASPYVTTAPTTPGLNLQQMRLPGQTAGESERKKVVLSGSTSGPGMKNLIGNIKRALGSKTSSAESYSEIMIMDNTNAQNRQVHRLEGFGRSANVPMEVFNKTEASNAALGSIRAAMRIDLLADQITTEFQRMTNRQPVPGQGVYESDAAQSRSDQDARPSSLLQPPAAIAKLPSGMTSSSQSIVIFDDTGINVPGSREGSGADRTPRESVQMQSHNGQDQQSAAGKSIVGHLAPDFIPQRRGSANAVEISTQEIDGSRASSMGTPNHLSFAGRSHIRNPSQASSLRRVASYQSALNKPLADSQGSRFNSGTNTPDADASSSAPARGLRRVPGGDLRANQNIADLEPLPRPKSTGSIATFSSARESEMLSFGDRITKTFKRDRTDRPLISPGLTGSFDQALKDDVVPKKVSLIRTHSEEKADRRPSFEAVVASFAEIPDEEEGGIEATLMKLEGRYTKGVVPKKASRKAEQPEADLERVDSAGSADTVQQQANETGESQHSGEGSQSSGSRSRKAVQTMASTDYARSEDSYNSTPLLERGTDSIDPLAKGKSRAPRSLARPRDATKSFLLDEGDDDDDDMSDGTFDTMDTVESNTPDNDLAQDPRPPSPPISDENVAKLNQASRRAPQEIGLPTPDPSPSRRFVQPQFANVTGPTSHVHPAAPTGLPPSLQPRHMPFVLGHDSEVMFQQLTLIEKDALREIDWRDLVHMRWQLKAETITNWVTYLSTHDPPGIDMVTSRFNIVVKWALSEIVLTDNAEDRALTIIKYIHIASAARRHGNYATLLQLTIALTSADCTRLKATWALVPQAEKSTLASLEALVTPQRNFAALRSEMEDAPADSGCIPVLALYIHDLTYNSQKPVSIESQVPGAGPLVNFERFRSTAVIVKNLLRLIDASSRYNFVPVDDVLSHCMWTACLPDNDIWKRSKAIEAAEKATA